MHIKYTKRLAEKIIREVIESDVKNVAQRNGLSDKEVETILKEKFSDLLKIELLRE